MESFLLDLAVIGAMCAVAIISFRFAYMFGAPVWEKNFAIPDISEVKFGPFRFRSAEIGELGNLLIVAAVLTMLLLVLMPDANLLDVMREWWIWFAGALVVGIVVVFGYTRFAVKKVRKDNRFAQKTLPVTNTNIAKLDIGYRFYVGYGVVISMLIFAIFLVILMQLLIDKSNFDLASTRIEGVFAQAAVLGTSPDDLLGRFEVAFGQQRIAEGFLLDEVNSLLMLLLCIMIAYTAIYRTQMRHVFAPAALTFLRRCIIVMIGFCVVFGCYIFFTKHLIFIDHVLDEFRRHESTMNGALWSLTQRYNEMIADLTKQRGAFGFLLALTTDRGGLIIVIPLLQYLQPWKPSKEKIIDTSP